MDCSCAGITFGLFYTLFISCLDSYSDGTHSLKKIHWWTSAVMIHFSDVKICSEEETNSSTSWMAWCEYFFSKVKCLNYSFIFYIIRWDTPSWQWRGGVWWTHWFVGASRPEVRDLSTQTPQKHLACTRFGCQTVPLVIHVESAKWGGNAVCYLKHNYWSGTNKSISMKHAWKTETFWLCRKKKDKEREIWTFQWDTQKIWNIRPGLP